MGCIVLFITSASYNLWCTKSKLQFPLIFYIEYNYIALQLHCNCIAWECTLHCVALQLHYNCFTSQCLGMGVYITLNYITITLQLHCLGVYITLQLHYNALQLLSPHCLECTLHCIGLQLHCNCITIALHHSAWGWECLPRQQLEAVQPLPCYERPRT